MMFCLPQYKLLFSLWQTEWSSQRENDILPVFGIPLFFSGTEERWNKSPMKQ
jgi:hypothetical protein